MKRFRGLEFHPFVEEDVRVLTPVMKHAFDAGAKKDTGKSHGGPPGYDNGGFLKRFALDPKSTAFKVVKAGKPVGGLILWLSKSGSNRLGCIFVDAPLHDKGIGTTMWKFVEKEYQDTKVWRTNTPGFTPSTHVFYVNKCGFRVVKIAHSHEPEKISYLMEKVMTER